MRLRIVSIAFILLCSVRAEAQTPALANFLDSGNPNALSQLVSSVVDRNGNTVIWGTFFDTITLGQFQLHSPNGLSSCFLERLDPQGNPIWVKVFSGPPSGSMALDSSGNIDIAGSFSGTLTFGSYVLHTALTPGIFLVHCDSNGNVAWAKSFINDDVYGSLATDTAGDLYVYCGLTNTAVLDSFNVVGVPSFHTNMLAKYSKGGQALWGRTLDIHNNFQIVGMSVSIDGNVILTGGVGTAGATIDFISFSASNGTAPSALSLYSSGFANWGQEFGGSGTAQSASSDATGNVFVTGSFTGTLHIGALPALSARAHNQAFITKLNTKGNPVWSEIAGDSLPTGYLQADADGNLYYGTEFASAQHIGSFVVAPSDSSGLCVVKFDVDGAPIWVTTVGTSMNGMGIDKSGNTYILGDYIRSSKDTLLDRLLNEPPTSDTTGALWAKIADLKLITHSPGKQSYCTGDTILVDYSSTSVFFTTNEFQVELSDSSGTFTGRGSQIIGQSFSHASAGTIQCMLPNTVLSGTNYALRVISNHPVLRDIEFGPTFSVKSRPSLSILARKGTSVCQGGSVHLEAVGNGYFRWSSTADSTVNDTSSLIDALKTGMYYVAMTNKGGCQTLDSIAVTILPPPNATLSIHGDTSICQGEQLSVTASGGRRYMWSTLDTLPTLTITSEGSYSVDIWSDSGCDVTLGPFSVTILQSPKVPSITIHGDTLLSSADSDNQWFRDAILLDGDTTSSIVVNQSGDYSVGVSNKDGCSAVSLGIKFDPSSVQEQVSPTLTDFTISPNPFGNATTLSFDLPKGSNLTVEISDVLGRSISTLAQGYYSAGHHQLPILITNTPASGVYFIRAHTNSFVCTERIVSIE